MSNPLPNPMSESEIRKQAASQIDLEIKQAVAPIQSQVTTEQAKQERALGQIGGMFDALQPVVQQASQAVTSAYNQATIQQKSIYAEAQAQLANQRADRAADAQQMAQFIGGPVAIEKWTDPIDDAATDLTYLGAGQQLQTLAYAQAGVQRAEQFAGQVFPLVRTEQMASVRQQYEDKIREYQEQITALKSQKGAQVNKRYNELRTQELTYGLQRAQYQLEKLNSQRTYNLEVKKAKFERADANRTYQLEKAGHKLAVKKLNADIRTADELAAQGRVELSIKWEGLRLEAAKLFGIDDKTGMETLDKIIFDESTRQAWKALDQTDRELVLKAAELTANTKTQQAAHNATMNTLWIDLLEQAINPEPGATYTYSKKVPISREQALDPLSDDPTISSEKIGNKVYYYRYQTITEKMPDTPRLTDPNKIIDYLVVAVNDPKYMTRARATEIIQKRFGEVFGPMGWHKYGDPWPPPKAPKGPQFGRVLEQVFSKFVAEHQGTSGAGAASSPR